MGVPTFLSFNALWIFPMQYYSVFCWRTLIFSHAVFPTTSLICQPPDHDQNYKRYCHFGLVANVLAVIFFTDAFKECHNM